jgi:hypothetical protein
MLFVVFSRNGKISNVGEKKFGENSSFSWEKHVEFK